MTATGVTELHDVGASNGESAEICAHFLTKSISPFHDKYRSIHGKIGLKIATNMRGSHIVHTISFSFAIGHCCVSDAIVLADCTYAPIAFSTCGKSSRALYLGGMQKIHQVVSF